MDEKDAARELYVSVMTHYRHLEDQRLRVTNLYYTFVFAFLGAAGLVISTGTVNAGILLNVAFVILALLCLYGLMVYAHVTRIQAAIFANETIAIKVLKDSFQEKYDEVFSIGFRDTINIYINSSLVLRALGAIGSDDVPNIFLIFIIFPVVISCLLSYFLAGIQFKYENSVAYLSIASVAMNSTISIFLVIDFLHNSTGLIPWYSKQ